MKINYFKLKLCLLLTTTPGMRIAKILCILRKPHHSFIFQIMFMAPHATQS